MYFKYGEKELSYLKAKDKRLGEVIDRLGFIPRPVDHNLFSAVVNAIIGQQISTKAHATIWQRFKDHYQELTPEAVLKTGDAELQALGISFKKVEYIKDFAKKIVNKEFVCADLNSLSDKEAIAALVNLKGIGVWTSEMMLMHSLERPDILSYGDLGILRGMRMVYHHRKIDKSLFEKYRRRLSPYGSIASFYFWAVAGGAIAELKDLAPNPKTNLKVKPSKSKV